MVDSETLERHICRARLMTRDYFLKPNPDSLLHVLGVWDQILGAASFLRLPPQVQVTAWNSAAGAFWGRYTHSKELKDLDSALSLWTRAKRVSTVDSQERGSLLTRLGVGLQARYLVTHSTKDLEKIISHYTSAVGESPTAEYLKCLGHYLYERYDQTHDVSDLERAQQLLEAAIANAECSSSQLALSLKSLGGVLLHLYELRGHISDLEKAIASFENAMRLTAPDSDRYAEIVAGLAASLQVRWSRTRRKEDLDQGIRLMEQAGLTGAHLQDAACSSSLANLYLSRYEHAADVDDLNRAIEVYRQSLTHTVQSSAGQATLYHNLGVALTHRFSKTHDHGDVDDAVQAARMAVELTATNSRQWAEHMDTLGTALRTRFERTHKVADLEEAVGCYSNAVAASPRHSAGHLTLQSNLAAALASRFKSIGTTRALRAAVEACQERMSILESTLDFLSIPYKLGHQEQWVSAYEEAVELYLYASHSALDDRSGLLNSALVAAESSKSRVLASLLTRTSPPSPRSVPKQLLVQEQELFSQLARLEASELSGRRWSVLREASERTSVTVRERLLGVHRKIAACGEDGLRYSDVRLGKSLSKSQIQSLLTDAGKDAALCSMFWLEPCLQLFLLRQGDACPWESRVELPWSGGQVLSRLRRETHNRKGSVSLESTWYGDLKDLLAELGSALRGCDVLILAPHRWGHLVPWGAVMLLSDVQASVVIQPSFQVLESILRTQAKDTSGALVVGDPKNDLGHARREAELVAGMLGCRPYIGSLATKEEVLRQLGSVRIAHFATHGFFDPNSPFDSGILLADGVLTARDFLTREIPAPEFVVLSACESGALAPLGGDEMAGLAHALICAGTRSLVVSLWRVDDAATSFLFERFYKYWLVEKQTKAYAMRSAMKDTRSAGTDWSSMHYWGAFCLLGDWR